MLTYLPIPEALHNKILLKKLKNIALQINIIITLTYPGSITNKNINTTYLSGQHYKKNTQNNINRLPIRAALQNNTKNIITTYLSGQHYTKKLI